MADVHDLLGQALGGVAPSPDALQATIQRIHRRQRRRRVLVACVTLAALAGAGVVVTQVAGERGDPLSAPAPTTVTPSTIPSSTIPPSAAGFVPRTIREGNRTVLPITFPDGSTAELVYPTALGLAGLGVQPDVSLLRARDPGLRYELVFSRGGPVPGLLKGHRPVGRYQTTKGRPVQLWQAVENPGVVSASYGYWLQYRIGAWTVLAGVADRAMAAEVARNLDGHQTGDGFVVIQASGPFALSRVYGEGRGAQLAIGDRNPLPDAVVAEPWRLIELSPARGSCQQEGVSGDHGTKCLGPPGAGIFANISGDPSWVKAVVRGLQTRNVHLAP
jgi:hypothetical protein